MACLELTFLVGSGYHSAAGEFSGSTMSSQLLNVLSDCCASGTVQQTGSIGICRSGVAYLLTANHVFVHLRQVTSPTHGQVLAGAHGLGCADSPPMFRTTPTLITPCAVPVLCV